MFSRPLSSLWMPALTSMSAPTRPGHRETARVGVHHTREDLEERGLAGAVGPDQADGLPRLDVDADVA